MKGADHRPLCPPGSPCPIASPASSGRLDGLARFDTHVSHQFSVIKAKTRPGIEARISKEL